MHAIRKQRLLVVLFVVIGSTIVVGLMLYAMRNSINLFYPPHKIVAGEAPVGRSIKAGGCVVPGSVERQGDSLAISFDITDGIASVPVVYEGILPDLFDEGEAAVVDGSMDRQGVLHATRVLAKHDETYTPAEVSDALETASAKSDAYKTDGEYAAADSKGAAYNRGVEDLKTCKGMKYDS